MKYLFKVFSTIAFILCLFSACQRELHETIDNTIVQPDPEWISTSIQGKVLNENGLPLQGSTVTIGTHTTLTNESGIFRFEDVLIDLNTSVVKVAKPGYFTGIRPFSAHENALNFVRLQLIPQNLAGTFPSASGGTVTVPNGGSITFSANSIVLAAGNAPYSGPVNVSAYFIDPSLPEFAEIMPGDLRGLLSSGGLRLLQSYGMLAVELTGAAGEKLQLGVNQPASLTLPIIPTQLATAPASVPMWWFDEVKGLWMEQGVATKTGNTYTTKVSHFSFWNVDYPMPVVKFEATIKNTQGIPLFDTKVAIKAINSSAISFARTDSTGKVSGFVFANQPLEISVYDNCNTVAYQKNIGPFTTEKEVVLDDITIALPYMQNLTISGNALNCAGTPLLTGIAFLTIEDYNYSAEVKNGAFSFVIDRCNPKSVNAIVKVLDVENLKISAPTTVSSVTAGSYSTGGLTACDVSITEFFNYSLNTVNYSFLPPIDKISCTTVAGIHTISAIQQQGSDSTLLNLSFPGTGIGQVDATDFTIWAPNDTYNTYNLQINITEFGAVGEYLSGNYNGTIRSIYDSTFQMLPLTGSFKVKRK